MLSGLRVSCASPAAARFISLRCVFNSLVRTRRICRSEDLPRLRHANPKPMTETRSECHDDQSQPEVLIARGAHRLCGHHNQKAVCSLLLKHRLVFFLAHSPWPANRGLPSPPRGRGLAVVELVAGGPPLALVRFSGGADSVNGGGGRLASGGLKKFSRDRMTGGFVLSNVVLDVARDVCPQIHQIHQGHCLLVPTLRRPVDGFVCEVRTRAGRSDDIPGGVQQRDPVQFTGPDEIVSADSSRSLETTPPKRRCERSTIPRVVEMSFARRIRSARAARRTRKCSVTCQPRINIQAASRRP